MPERIRPALAALSAACLIAILVTFRPLAPLATSLGSGTLSNGTVTPPGGTSTTTFVFRVDYVSTNNDEAAIWVQAGPTRVDLALVSGSQLNGTFRGSGT
ncbi:MAG TPA: hypothetical protein VFP30_07040, partial [Candidatus Limnocylindria bacterium]|nr:hypothetical protein [Candidatus Limnocylindria bacterium]